MSVPMIRGCNVLKGGLGPFVRPINWVVMGTSGKRLDGMVTPNEDEPALAMGSASHIGAGSGRQPCELCWLVWASCVCWGVRRCVEGHVSIVPRAVVFGGVAHRGMERIRKVVDHAGVREGRDQSAAF